MVRNLGQLPAGITLSSGGLLSGVPSAAGTVTFSVKATDTAGQSVSVPLSLAVVSVLTITTSSLVTGHSGVSYSVNFVASGGTAPYSWALSAGQLPSGMSLTLQER